MRERLFRGKRTDNGQWVEGYYVYRPDGKHLIYWKPFQEASQNTYHEVIPESVGQFTGLLFKNGKKIFEGDKFDDEDECFILIEWIKENSCFGGSLYGYDISIGEGSQEVYDNKITCIDRNLYSVSDLIDYEIIENIHDNPELL